MSSGDVKGFLVSPAKVAFLLSLIALGTFGWQAAGRVIAAEFQIQANAKYIEEDKVSTRQILSEVQAINRKVDQLTIYLQANDIVPSK